MIVCLYKQALLTQLGQLDPTDPAFLEKADEVVRRYKDHMTSGHPASTRKGQKQWNLSLVK
jgi:hypothetical protein